MVTITLPKQSWEYDPTQPLGPPGGFGAVFAGRGPDGEDVAVKRLHLNSSDAAQRELRMADALTSTALRHVLPFCDAGMDSASGVYYLVMPRADESLQDYLRAHGALPQEDAAAVVLAIASGLQEVPTIVHRDLKPGNILKHEGVWKVADFGIARFVEESTSLNTLRECLTPAYAAPEQWTLDPTSAATDVYALGVIAYQLVAGTLPFPGPTSEAFKHQHLHQTPAALPGPEPRYATIVGMMLRKPPTARPPLAQVVEAIRSIAAGHGGPLDAGPGLEALAQASHAAAQAALAADAQARRAESAGRTRRQIWDTALQELYVVRDGFAAQLRQAAPAVSVATSADLVVDVRLGDAKLQIYLLPRDAPVAADAFTRSRWDVVAGAVIRVIQEAPSRYVWSANLWYTNRGRTEGYRWWEVSYMVHPLKRSHPESQPFAVTSFADADQAASPVMGQFQFASNPTPIDGECLDAFRNRWAGLLAKAHNGQLRSPSHLPLP